MEGSSVHHTLLKLQYFGHLMWRAESFEKTLIWERLEAGGEGDNRGWDGWMASLTQPTWVCANSGRQWRTGKPGVLQSMRVTKSQTRLSNWTTTIALRLTEPRASLIQTLLLHTGTLRQRERGSNAKPQHASAGQTLIRSGRSLELTETCETFKCKSHSSDKSARGTPAYRAVQSEEKDWAQPASPLCYPWSLL